MKKKNFKLFLSVLLGNLLIGISIGVMRLVAFGADPFSSMNIGISSQIPLSFGTVQFLMNVMLFIPMLLFYRKGFGIGTIINMVGCGYVADFLLWMLKTFNISTQTVGNEIYLRIVLMIFGVILLSFGVALYMESNLGVSPYDALGPLIEERTKGHLKFKWARMITDLICVIIGYFFGAIIGVGTVILAFFAGPIISWFKIYVVKRWI